MPDLMTIIPIVIIVGCIIGIISAGYVKASPDKAYIISGLRKTPKVLIGKAGLKIPFLEKKDELNLQLIPIDVKTFQCRADSRLYQYQCGCSSQCQSQQ